MSVGNLFSHTVSCVAKQRALYYASVMESATTGCLLQYVAAPDIINRFPIVECLSFMSPAQSASENPTGELSVDLSYLIRISIVPLR